MRFPIRRLSTCLVLIWLWAMPVWMLAACGSPSPPHWESCSDGIKPESDVVLVTVDPRDPQTVYLATYEPGGLYRSTDGGMSWQWYGEGLEGVTVLSLDLDPENDQTLFVGTMCGGYRSADGGKTWQRMSGLPAAAIYTLAIASDGRAIYAGTEADGVYVSRDGGASWTRTGPERVSVLSLAVVQSGMIYAGSSGEGVWISDDDGAQWHPAGAPLDEGHVPNLVATRGGALWAIADGLLYLSEDGGESWRLAGPSGFEARSMAVEAHGGEVIYMGGRSEEIAVSHDGGTTWQVVASGVLESDITCFGIDTTQPEIAYLGTKGDGSYKTTDGGHAWSATSHGDGKRVVSALVNDPQDTATLYAGTVHGVYRSTDGGEGWSLISRGVGESYVQALVVHPEDRDVIYAGAETGVYVSRDGGGSWKWATRGLGSITIFSLTIAPDDHDNIYAGSWGNNVLRSSDGGASWAPVHHGLETLSVYSFSIDPTNPDVLYAGTVEAIYKSTDRGESWRGLEGMRPSITAFALVLDPTDPPLVYAGTTDGVYRSADEGETWRATREGMGCVTVTSLALDPTAPGTLYAGTEHRGLFRSTDRGEHWISWGLPETSIYAIVIDETTGRMWLGTDEGVFRC